MMESMKDKMIDGNEWVKELDLRVAKAKRLHKSTKKIISEVDCKKFKILDVEVFKRCYKLS
jgi:hypothetical protein